jgi:hypothetical protein
MTHRVFVYGTLKRGYPSRYRERFRIGCVLRDGRDHWVEYLRCPHCRKTGVALVSAADEYSWNVQVDRAPEGFKVVKSGDVRNFYCATCDCAVEP